MPLVEPKFKSKEVISAWKYICQLRVQLDKNKASLVLGAGISWDLNLPLWGSLIEKIKEAIYQKAPEAKMVSETPGKAALFLFEIFYSYRKIELIENASYADPSLMEKKILSDWRELIHDALYSDTEEKDRKKTIEKHPYFKEMIEFITRSELTINYNFDDYIEFGLSQENLKLNKTERPYQTIWSHHAQFTNDKCVIYHPNGFLPLDKKKFQSENLIFSDGAFADQLLDGIGGGLSTLLHVLTKKTSILLGHSLSDSTLLHLLRKASNISPGNYNYFIKFMGEDEELDTQSRSAIFEANFNNYNLITLFFKNADIKEFLHAITLTEEEFLHQSDILGLPTKYCYYLVGSIGIGKSTVLSQFGNLSTLDEWFDERPPEMANSPDDLSTDKTMTIDTWTNQQFGKKNNYLTAKKVGLFIIDRSPIDPLTFVVDVTIEERARSMLEEGIRPCKSSKTIECGEIIHMIGEPTKIWSRLITKRKETSWPSERIKSLQDMSLELYKPLTPKIVCSTSRTEKDVVRDVAKILFSPKYSPADLDAAMRKIANV